MSDDGARRPPADGESGPRKLGSDAVPGGPAQAPPLSPLPSWLHLPDDRPSTLLPPWPDELVTKRNAHAALGWIDRLSLPVHIKKTHLFAFARYTGVRFTGPELAALEDFRPPPAGGG